MCVCKMICAWHFFFLFFFLMRWGKTCSNFIKVQYKNAEHWNIWSAQRMKADLIKKIIKKGSPLLNIRPFWLQELFLPKNFSTCSKGFDVVLFSHIEAEELRCVQWEKNFDGKSRRNKLVVVKFSMIAYVHDTTSQILYSDACLISWNVIAGQKHCLKF